ncbi:MAG: restriction endonuclease subunit M [Tepidisphaera sp.]
MREWKTSTLGELFEIARGGSPRPIKNFITTAADGVNWIKIGDAKLDGKYIYSTEDKIKPAGMKRSRFVKEGDFILSNSMSFGRPYILKTSGCIHDGWLLLRPRAAGIDENFLYYALSSNVVYDQFDRLAAGSIVRNLNIDSVKSVQIAVPPLPEQQRIVGILDEAFAAIATAKANTEKSLTNARALFVSHLQAVFIQQGEGWKVQKVGDIAKYSFGKMLDKAKNKGKPQPYLRNVNVRWFSVDLSDMLEMRFLPEEADKYTAIKGDVLICEGGYPGRCAIWGEDYPVYFQKALHRVRFQEPAHNKWLVYYLYLLDTSGQLRQYFTGSGIQHFTGEALGRLNLPIPPLTQLRRFVARFEDLHTETQRLESLAQQKLAALDALKKSLLHQAFTGQLTADAVARTPRTGVSVR